jgi:single-stranded-DNA-specific exonuclease
MLKNILKSSTKITKKELFDILNNRFKDDNVKKLSDFENPFILKDMKKATKRVKQAIENREKIVLIGDYDVDGVVSCVVVKEFFDYIGYNIDIYIPDRFKDGYGISSKIVQNIEADLIITVDNGISAINASLECKKKGIDLIITDHHTPPDDRVEAYAIINPKQKECDFKNKDICGAVVAWYFVAALKQELEVSFDLKYFFDLLCIATIADAMPLKSFNRVIVKKGLELIKQSNRPSIIAFREKTQKQEFTAEDIGYIIAPKLNASGRIKNAKISFDFLYSKDLDDAKERLEELWDINEKRKEIEQDIVQKADKNINSDDDIIVVWGENWHEGVIGIVASRLSDKYLKPSIVFSVSGDTAKGSARSIGDVDIYSLIKEQQDILLGFGGHKLAAGLQIKTNFLHKFKKNINTSAKKINRVAFIPKIDIVGSIDFDFLDEECFNMIDMFEPYGIENPKPLFLAHNVDVVYADRVGANKDHLKITVKDNNIFKKAISFFETNTIQRGQKVSFAYSLVKNEFKNNISYEIMIKRFL